MQQNVITPIEFIKNWKDKYIVPIDFGKTSVEFIVPGSPRGKERPRTVRIGGRITTYTPKNTVNYENLVRKQYKSIVGNTQLIAPIQADITAIFTPPKSASKKERKRLLEEEYCEKKPDCDNIGKIILDSLNEVAYKDDSGICKMFVEKRYEEDEARVIVKLSEI